MKRYKCPVEWCRRYKFHLHCEDISKQVKKNFHYPMKHYGTFERVTDVMKPFGAIFTAIQPKPKRTYSRSVGSFHPFTPHHMTEEGRITYEDYMRVVNRDGSDDFVQRGDIMKRIIERREHEKMAAAV